jgi:rhodanese-related sulfurtransferase
MRRNVLILGALGVLVLVWARSGRSRQAQWSAVLATVRAQYTDVEHIMTDSLARALAYSQGIRPIVLDTRKAEEYAVSHLAGAIWLDPDEVEASAVDSLDRSSPIVTYCSVGYRSSVVARKLQRMGFKNVANLEGSIFKWANEGREVVREGRVVHAVHPYDAVWGRLLNEKLRAYSAD